MDQEMINMIELMIRMLLQLNKKFPLPTVINTTVLNFDTFNRPNPQQMPALIHYLLNIINPEKCSHLVPHPVKAKSPSHFNQAVIKFLIEIMREVPHVKINGLRVSTLATLSGERFLEFLAQLVNISIKLVYEKMGVLSVPSSAKLDPKVRSKIMQRIRDLKVREITELRSRNSTKIYASSSAVEALAKRKEVCGLLKVEYDKVASACPPPYNESLIGAIPETAVGVAKAWLIDLHASLNELEREREKIRELKEALGGNAELGSTEGPTRIERDSLLNPENSLVLSKVAVDQNITLFDGSALSLPAFLQCTKVIIDNLHTLIITSKLGGSIEGALKGIEKFTSTASDLSNEMNDLRGKIEGDKEEIKIQCDELQKRYDDLVASGKIVRRFFYSRPEPCSEVDILSHLKTPVVTLSPGNDWKIQVSEFKRKMRGIQPDTPVRNSPITGNFHNSSIRSFSRSVLLEQTRASGSRGADLPVGDMLPLSSSSPVHGPAGGHEGRFVTKRKSISETFVDGSSFLESDLSDFFPESMVSSVEDSDDFGEFNPVRRQVLSHQRGPINQSNRQEAVQPQVSTIAPPLPVLRQPRPSLEAIVKRYTALKAKMNVHN